MRKALFVLLAVVASALTMAAQIVTSEPSPLQENSQGVVLTFNAASPMCNGGLKNLSTDFEVYAHIGVITNKSTDDSNWKYTVTPWPSSGNDQQANTPKNKLTRVNTNTYTLNIGNIRSYFGITDAREVVKKIAMVFRTADGKKECKTSTGGDIFVDVLSDAFGIELTSDHADRVISEPTTITFTVQSTAAADLNIAVGDKVIASKTNTKSLSAAYKFDTYGFYTVKAYTTYNGLSYEETMEVSYPQSSLQQNYPGGIPRQGAVKNADGSVTFCLAAPNKFSVVLVGSWDNYQVLDKNVMKYQDYNGNRYFWHTVTGLKDNEYYPYYFIVDDTYKVADPYAHLVLDCYNDGYLKRSVWPDRPKYPSELSGIMLGCYRGDMDDYEFSEFEIPDHDNLVVYEMLFRDFTGVDGVAAGNGTVKKAIEKIPYIKSLGFNAIELMPIMEFNGNDSWGYNTNFYMAPDKVYGSPTDYKDFVEACHKQGIAVILDIVFNQSDGLHPWYQMYPIESNPFYNKTAPHQYSVLNDWNQGHPLVEQQWTDALKYWMEAYNVDGFRFDLVKGLGDNDSYRSGTEAYNQSRVDRMARLHSVIKSVKPKGIHINENLAGAQEETAMGNDGQINWVNVNNASCQYAMGWDDGNNNLMQFYAPSYGSRPWGSTVSYAESHDEERVAYKCLTYGNGSVATDEEVMFNRLGSLAAQMLLIPGPKMVWQFGELGNEQTTKSPDGGNDTGRKIVNWTEWLANDNRVYLKDTYAAIINLRMDNPTLFSRSATFTPRNLGSKFSNTRTIRLTAGDKEIIAFINPAVSGSANISATASVMTKEGAKLIWASKGFTPELKGSGKDLSVTVPAGSFALYASGAVSGIDSPVIPAESDIEIYGAEGEIVIVGQYTDARVYDMTGRAFGGLTVPAGIYIVNVDGKTAKVVVR